MEKKSFERRFDVLNDNAKEWVAALRSGEYQQTKDRLFDGEGHCCLGVGCKVCGLEPVFDGRDYKFDDMVTMLPKVVKEALGLRSEGGDYHSSNGSFTSLTDDNDSGKTFAEIADIIESEPEGLFV